MSRRADPLSTEPLATKPPFWQRRGLIRALVILGISSAVAAFVSTLGLTRDYGYLHASLLTGASDGAYYALGSDLSKRAKQDRGELDVVATEGSVDNVNRLIKNPVDCAEKFAFVQDGIPVKADSGLELLGRLPEPESLLLLGRRDHTPNTFGDLRDAAIGIGPAGSGTAYLMRQLLADPDMAGLNVRTTNYALDEQARLVAEGRIDLAAIVIRDDAEFLRNIVRKYDLEVAEFQNLAGLISRYPWLSIGRITAGRFDLLHPTPATDRLVPQINTLVLTNACAKRADRLAFLALLSAALPGFLRANPPSSTGTSLPLAVEARQFFHSGEIQFADRYFPWAVNLMSPVYWVYLAMAATALFNGLRAFSRFRLWRIDTTRERLTSAARQWTDGKTDDGSSTPPSTPKSFDAHAADILQQLQNLRSRCHRQVSSFVTPMGDEMFYRYQQSLIDKAIADLQAHL